jgi:hypothetical protein
MLINDYQSIPSTPLLLLVDLSVVVKQNHVKNPHQYAETPQVVPTRNKRLRQC